MVEDEVGDNCPLSKETLIYSEVDVLKGWQLLKKH